MTRIAWKAFWTVTGATAAVAAAAVPVTLELSTLVRLSVSVGVALLLGLVFMYGASITVLRGRAFATFKYLTRVSIMRWLGLATAVHEVWVILFSLRPDLWVVWIGGLLAIMLIQYGLARGLEFMYTQVKTREQAALERAEQEKQPAVVMSADGTRALDQYEQAFAYILRLAKLGYLRILYYKTIGDPSFGVVVTVRRPSYARAVKTGKAKGAGQVNELTQNDAEAIAIALQEETGRDMPPDFVQIQKVLEAAGTYTITVVTDDVMGRVYPYEEPPGYASIKDPAPIGNAIDGTKKFVNLKQHGQVIGGSTSGKSSLLQTLIAFITRCPDALLWVCGTQKLYDLVAGWLEPFMDTDLPLPIDWVAKGQEDLLAMLESAMNVARYRQDVDMDQRGNWRTIILIMDEASFPLDNSEIGIMFEGRPCTASKMAEHITRGANSGDVHILFASQRSTNDDFGDHGGAASSNISWSASFFSNDDAETGRLTGNYSLPMPRHRGQFWLKVNDGGQLPMSLKADYIQTVDKGKPVLHDGLTTIDVARARMDMMRFGERELDAGSAQAAGPAYRNRFRRMTAEYKAYLKGRGGTTPQQLQTGTAGAAPQLPAGQDAAPLPGPVAGPPAGPAAVSNGYVHGASEGLNLLAALGLPVLAPDGSVLAEPGNGDGSVAANAGDAAQGESAPVEGLIDDDPVDGADEQEMPAGPPAEPLVSGPVSGPVFYGPGTGTERPGRVATMEHRRTRADRVVELLQGAERPWPRAVLLSELHESGDEVDAQVLTNLLTKLAREGRVERVGDGYQLPGGDRP